MVVALIAASACDMTGIPRVAGTYTGMLSISAVRLGITGAAPMRLNVEQAGSQLTVSGSVTLPGGDTAGIIPAMRGTVDATGVFEATGLAGVGQTVGTTPDFGVCGTVGPGGIFTLTFSGREAEFNLVGETSRCGIITYHATLTR